jgi:hypothetical protein
LAPDIKFRSQLYGVETLPRAIEIYEKIIKEDTYAVKQVYLHSLSAYTPEPSNLQCIAPTSEGKTYNIVNVTSYFPDHDVWDLGGLSPTAIYHDPRAIRVDKDTGKSVEPELAKLYKQLIQADDIEKPKERRKAQREIKRAIADLMKNSVPEIRLENTIINFLDKPNSRTLEMLKPLMSHDKYEIYYKITNKTTSGRLQSENIKLKGWPVILAASTKVSAKEDTWAEIVSRFDTISPNQSKTKYRAAVEFTAAKKGLPGIALRDKLDLIEFDWLRKQIREIKLELIAIKESHRNGYENITANIFWIPGYEKLGKELPAEVGRHMRDSTRFFTILQMHAAANIFNRPRLLIDSLSHIIVTRNDYIKARDLYFGEDPSKTESIFTGVSEKSLRFYKEVFWVCWKDRLKQTKTNDEENDQQTLTAEEDEKENYPYIWVTTRDLTDKSKTCWDYPLNSDTLRKSYLDELELGGYIDKQNHPTDKRANHYRPLTSLEDMGKKGILRDTHIFSLESLREALEQLRKITEKKRQITIHDFNGERLTIEQLYEKYYTENGSISSFIDSGDKTSQLTEISDEIGDSRITPDIPVNREDEA